MVNSHYIPQFILRNFCENGQITLCDLDKKKIQLRNPRSVFSEKGYYPDSMEKELSTKAEYLFANLYHQKLEDVRNSISLNADELFILKKYLIVSSIRYHYEYSKEENEFLDQLGDSYKPHFIDDLNYILSCDSVDKMMGYIIKMNKVLNPSHPDPIEDMSVHLWAEIKDILQSYIVFVTAPKDEEFLIPDIGKGIYEGPMSRRKVTGLLDIMISQGHTELIPIVTMLTPHDYTVFPLSKRLAVLSMSVFFKLLTDSEIRVNVILPDDCPTVSSVLNFGSRDAITPPKVRYERGVKTYRYDVKRLSAADISHFNSLMLAEAKHFVAYSDISHLKKTLSAVREYSDRDISFMTKSE